MFILYFIIIDVIIFMGQIFRMQFFFFVQSKETSSKEISLCNSIVIFVSNKIIYSILILIFWNIRIAARYLFFFLPPK